MRFWEHFFKKYGVYGITKLNNFMVSLSKNTISKISPWAEAMTIYVNKHGGGVNGLALINMLITLIYAVNMRIKLISMLITLICK
jgi:hypothetical protein